MTDNRSSPECVLLKALEEIADPTLALMAETKADIAREAIEKYRRSTEAATPPDLSVDPIASINRRLEDLAEANAIYGKDQRLNAPDKIARNAREISWLKNLRSMIAMHRVAQGALEPSEAAVNCARFVRWAVQEGPWQGGDLDGGSVQDKAEELGLIVSVPYDPEKHGAYNDYGCDAGDPWFEFSAGFNAVRTSSLPSAQDQTP
jgi:hypothetical protein